MKKINLIVLVIIIMMVLYSCLTTSSSGRSKAESSSPDKSKSYLENKEAVATISDVPSAGKLQLMSNVELPINATQVSENILGKGTPEIFMPGITFPVMAEFSPDGQFILFANSNGYIALYSADPFLEIRTYNNGQDVINNAFFSADGRYIFAQTLKKVSMWDTVSGKLIREIIPPGCDDAHPITGSTFFDNLSALIVLVGGEIQFIDYKTGHMIDKLDIISTGLDEIPGTNRCITGNALSDCIECWDLKSKDMIWAIGTGDSMHSINSIQVSPDGSKAYATFSLYDVKEGKITGKIYELETDTGEYRCLFDNLKGPLFKFVPAPDGRHFFISQEGTVRMFDGQSLNEIGSFNIGETMPEEIKKLFDEKGIPYLISNIAPSPDGKRLVIFGSSSCIWNLEKAEAETTFIEQKKTLSTLPCLTDNGIKLSVRIDSGYITWDAYSGELLDPIDEAEALNASSPWNKREFLAEDVKNSWKNDSYIVTSSILNRVTEIVDAHTGRTIHQLSGYVSNIVFTQDNSLFATTGTEGKIVIWDTDTGRQLKNFPKEGGAYYGLFFSPDNKRLYGYDSNGTYCYNIETGRYIGTFIATVANGGIAITEGGYFSGNEAGIAQLKVRMGNRVLPLDAFYDQFYNPMEVAAAFAFESGTSVARQTSQPAASMQKITVPPPKVSLYVKGTDGSFTDAVGLSSTNTAQNEVTIRVEAASRYGKVGEIKVRNNGKIIDTSVRGLTVKAVGDRVTQDFVIPLVEGSNRITAVALSEQLIESAPVYCSLNYTPPAPSAPDMYVLAVGINEYKNGRYSLDYAVGDVEGFISSLTPIADPLYDELFISKVTNGNATRETIISELEAIASKAAPEDVFIFYYAGHGIALTDSEANIKSEFYYVLHDVTQMTSPDKIREAGISGTELREFFKKIPAMKQIAMLDACNSGAFAESFAYRGAAEEQALAKLSRATGSAIIAATRDDQFAAELAKLGHGAFTMAVIEALEGKAATAKSQVTASSVRLYLDDRLPEITAEYSGSEQYPISFIFGQDFPIGVIK